MLKNTAKNRCNVQNAIKYSCVYKNDTFQDSPMVEGTRAKEEKEYYATNIEPLFRNCFFGVFCARLKYHCFCADSVYITCVERFVSYTI